MTGETDGTAVVPQALEVPAADATPSSGGTGDALADIAKSAKASRALKDFIAVRETLAYVW